MFPELEDSESAGKSPSWVNTAVGSRMELLEAVGNTTTDGGMGSRLPLLTSFSA